MAYQTRLRTPLLDSGFQAALIRRVEEGVGFALLAAGLTLLVMLVSYAPEDPTFMVPTDGVPQNLLGQIGASIAAVLIMIVGYAAYVLPVAILIWGARLFLHMGADRAFGRFLYLPVAVALLTIYAASVVPPQTWTHSFGLGGLFGDTVLGAVLNALPITPRFGLKILAALSFLVGGWMLLYVLGMTRTELTTALRFVAEGFERKDVASADGTFQTDHTSHRTSPNFSPPVYTERDHYAWSEEAQSPPQQRAGNPVLRETQGLRSKPKENDPGPKLRQQPRASDLPTPHFRAIAPEEISMQSELVERPLPAELWDVDAPDDDRIRAKIADAVKNRVQRPGVHPHVEPASAAIPASPPPSNPPLNVPDSNARYSHDMPTAADYDPVLNDDFTDVDPPHAEPPLFDADVDTDIAPRVTLTRRMVQRALKRAPIPSRQAMADAQPSLALHQQPADVYEHPPLTLLANPNTVQRHHLSDEALEENAKMLENVLDDYGVKGEIVSVRPGPVVTMYELEPAPGLKASRVISLADDIARSMSALSARVSTVPGRSVIGIELPNHNREKVLLREILSHRDFGDGNQRLPLALGKGIDGDPVIANLAKMPHLLIAGTTGSGKSVAINTMILSLLYKLSPKECRMIMIDPKMLELSVYDGIPHLLSPVVTDPKKAVVALKWVVGEMEDRYRKMSKMGVRNIEGYNSRVEDTLEKGEMFSRTFQTGFDDATGEPVFETEEFAPEKIPYIVVVVDEMADLMMVAGKEIEACIQRLAQMARASGIHIIMATQRPSVDVITGTIKANFPTRISFHVTSKVDSRTILGEMGAEQLLGMGDMLYMAGGAKITRVHGPFVSDEEVEEIVRHLKSFGPPDYAANVLNGPDEDKESDIDAVLGLSTGGNTNKEDALYDQAVAIVVKDRKCSTSYIQRKLGIGYNKAARLVEQMEDAGLVSAANHVGKREILVPEQA